MKRAQLASTSETCLISPPRQSSLTVGGLIKHVSRVEARWADFLEIGTAAFDTRGEDPYAAHQASFVMGPDESLADLLAEYAEVAARTDKLLGSVDLDTDHPLPVTPWWPEGTRWSLRRAVVHIVAETAQHAGHADIVREAIDGQLSMG